MGSSPQVSLNTNVHDFVPSHISDTLQGPEFEGCQTLKLRSSSANLLELGPLHANPNATTYNIKSNQTGGFMNRKPHMAISKLERGLMLDFAEVRFQTYGQGTSVIYKETGTTQTLSLQSAASQAQECFIGARSHVWKPLGPSRNVLELTDEAHRRVALFVYAGEVASITGPATGSRKHTEGDEIGELYILRDVQGGQRATDEIIGSALAIVERAKRRAANVGNVGSNRRQGPGFSYNSVTGGLG